MFERIINIFDMYERDFFLEKVIESGRSYASDLIINVIHSAIVRKNFQKSAA